MKKQVQILFRTLFTCNDQDGQRDHIEDAWDIDDGWVNAISDSIDDGETDLAYHHQQSKDLIVASYSLIMRFILIIHHIKNNFNILVVMHAVD